VRNTQLIDFIAICNKYRATSFALRNLSLNKFSHLQIGTAIAVGTQRTTQPGGTHMMLSDIARFRISNDFIAQMVIIAILRAHHIL